MATAKRDGAKKTDDADEFRPTPARHARHNPSVIRKANGPRRSSLPHNPAAVFTPWPRQRTADGGNALQILVEQGNVHLQAVMQSVDGLLLRQGAFAGGWQQRRHHLACQFECLVCGRGLGRETPHDAAEQHDQHEAGNDRHVDLTVEAAHRVQSCALANT